MRPHSRGAWRPSSANSSPFRDREGAGKAGPRLRPVARLLKKMQAAGTTGSAGRPGLPCAMVLTAASRSPRCAGLSGHRLRIMLSHHRDLSVGRSGPRDLTVRIDVVRQLRKCKARHRCVHRSPLLRFVTIGRNAPLHRERDGGDHRGDLPDTARPHACGRLARQAICA